MVDLRTQTRLAHFLMRIERAGDAATWRCVFAVTLCLYLATAHWQTGQNTDGLVAALPGYQFVTQGTWDLSGSYEPRSLAGIIAGPDGVVVTRTMGVILAGLPGHLLLAWTGAEAGVCGALAAALLSALAVANVCLALRAVVSPRVAVSASLLLAFGTGLWTVGAAELWTHGPDAFWLSLALLGLSRGHWWLVGIGCLGGVITRPHLAVAAAILGLGMTYSSRSLRPALVTGSYAFAGVAALYAWNTWYYGAPSLGGSYGYALPSATRGVTSDSGQFAENVAGVLLSPLSGVFVYTPLALVALVAICRHSRGAAPWSKVAAVAGAVYLLVQMRISSNFDGGASYYGNRYAIESLVLVTPLAAHAVSVWAPRSRARFLATWVAAGASVAIYAFGAFLTYWWVSVGFRSSWRAWYPYFVGSAAGPAGVAAAVAAASIVVLATAAALRAWETPRISGAVPEQARSAEPLAPSSAVPAQRPGAAASTRR